MKPRARTCAYMAFNIVDVENDAHPTRRRRLIVGPREIRGSVPDPEGCEGTGLAMVKTRGRLTRPWISRRCLAGHAAVVPLKVQPLGVIMPSSASGGVREAPLPVVPGWDRISVRVTVLSCLAGLP